MSSSLHYRPHINEETGLSLSFELKKAISQKYWEHDGSLGGHWIILTESDIPYLEGVRDGGIKDAGTLINEIRRYEAVEIALLA
jgi:hypothetical protein